MNTITQSDPLELFLPTYKLEALEFQVLVEMAQLLWRHQSEGYPDTSTPGGRIAVEVLADCRTVIFQKLMRGER